MSTIVEYTDAKEPENFYPWHIVSPPRSSPCCFSRMEEIGEAHAAERWECMYKRCRVCGFTVQAILRTIPDAVLAADVRRLLGRTFRRNACAL